MSNLIILAGGLFLAFSSLKKDFISVWILYINTIFAAVGALGFTFFVSMFLELPFLPGKIRPLTAFLLLFITLMVIFFKITEQILPKGKRIDNFPESIGKILSLIFGFITGCFYASLVVFLLGHLPLDNFVSCAEFKREGALKTVFIAYTAALQSVPAEKNISQELRLPGQKKKAKAAKKKEDQKTENSSAVQKEKSSITSSSPAEQTGEKMPKKKRRKKKPRTAVNDPSGHVRMQGQQQKQQQQMSSRTGEQQSPVSKPAVAVP